MVSEPAYQCWKHFSSILWISDISYTLFCNLQVDIAYAPFIERFRPFLLDVKKYDITEDRPKLAAWIEV